MARKRKKLSRGYRKNFRRERLKKSVRDLSARDKDLIDQVESINLNDLEDSEVQGAIIKFKEDHDGNEEIRRISKDIVAKYMDWYMMMQYINAHTVGQKDEEGFQQVKLEAQNS